MSGPVRSGLEQQARELERRAVDAEEALVRARQTRSNGAGSGSGARTPSSELRRLQAEADLLMDRALTARLEADRAAGGEAGSPASGTAPLPVTWHQRELGWEQSLAAALDETPETETETEAPDAEHPTAEHPTAAERPGSAPDSPPTNGHRPTGSDDDGAASGPVGANGERA